MRVLSIMGTRPEAIQRGGSAPRREHKALHHRSPRVQTRGCQTKPAFAGSVRAGGLRVIAPGFQPGEGLGSRLWGSAPRRPGRRSLHPTPDTLHPIG